MMAKYSKSQHLPQSKKKLINAPIHDIWGRALVDCIHNAIPPPRKNPLESLSFTQHDDHRSNDWRWMPGRLLRISSQQLFYGWSLLAFIFQSHMKNVSMNIARCGCHHFISTMKPNLRIVALAFSSSVSILDHFLSGSL